MMIKKEISRIWWLLRVTYALAFIGSGIDKFIFYLIDWNAQGIPHFLLTIGFKQATVLYVRGALEILIGLLLLTPYVRIAAYAAAVSLIGSGLYVFMVPNHFDTAIRYMVIGLCAYVFARIDVIREELNRV